MVCLGLSPSDIIPPSKVVDYWIFSLIDLHVDFADFVYSPFELYCYFQFIQIINDLTYDEQLGMFNTNYNYGHS